MASNSRTVSTVPSRTLAGERDESTPPALSEALHAAIPESVLVVIAGAAHLSNITQPDEFTTHITHFLGGQ